MRIYTSPTMTNGGFTDEGVNPRSSAKILAIEEFRKMLDGLQKNSEKYIELQNALIKTIGVITLPLDGQVYKVYNEPSKLLGGFGPAEHVYIGRATELKGLPENHSLLVVGEKIELKFGEILALAGDFFGIPNQPISLLGGDKEAKESRFMAAFNKLQNADLIELRKILDAIEHECLQVANSALPHHCYSSQLMEQNVKLRSAKKDYEALLEDNSDHFSTQAAEVYTIGHLIALRQAQDSGTTKNLEGLARAYAIEAFASHFLTDLFAAGHVRNQRGDLEIFLVSKLQIKAKRAKPLSALLTAAQHERDGKLGVNVRNGRENYWRAYGDGYFFTPQSEENQRRVLEATQNAVKEIYETYRTGDTTSDMSTWLPVATADKNLKPLYRVENNQLILYDGMRDIEIKSRVEFMRRSIPLALSHLPDSYITEYIKDKIKLAPPVIISKLVIPVLNEFTDVVWKSIGIASQAQIHQVSETINSKLDDMAALLNASYNNSKQILAITTNIVEKLETVQIKQKWECEYGEIRGAVGCILDAIHASSSKNPSYIDIFRDHAETMEKAYLRLSRVINSGTSSQINLIKLYRDLIISDHSKEDPELVKIAVTMWFRWLLDLEIKAFGIFMVGKTNQKTDIEIIEKMKATFEDDIEKQIKKHIEEIDMLLISKPLRYICLQYTNAKIKQKLFNEIYGD